MQKTDEPRIVVPTETLSAFAMSAYNMLRDTLRLHRVMPAWCDLTPSQRARMRSIFMPLLSSILTIASKKD